MKCDRDITPIF